MAKKSAPLKAPVKPKTQPYTGPQHPLAICKPRGDRVVVKRDITATTTQGGILLPGSFSNDKQQTGTIHSVGPGKYDDKGNIIPMDISVGDRVIITGWAGLEVKDPMGNSGSKDADYIMLREEDILAFLPS